MEKNWRKLSEFLCLCSIYIAIVMLTYVSYQNSPHSFAVKIISLWEFSNMLIVQLEGIMSNNIGCNENEKNHKNNMEKCSWKYLKNVHRTVYANNISPQCIVVFYVFSSHLWGCVSSAGNFASSQIVRKIPFNNTFIVVSQTLKFSLSISISSHPVDEKFQNYPNEVKWQNIKIDNKKK